MKQLLSLLFVLAALFMGACDFLGEDKGNGPGDSGGGGEESTLVVDD